MCFKTAYSEGKHPIHGLEHRLEVAKVLDGVVG
jgi:hypothetical protein